ncbi:MAG TPA: T9SS type A sorting domain-containing protein [Bacteroides sp.]|nr:T9SS type A sorting domain-containing protein [Bacteroides sp.]
MYMMKTIFTIFLFVAFAVGLNAQYALPVDFENPQEDTAWTQFANGDDLAENMVLAENPAKDGINTSDNCIKFVVVDNAAQWAGAVSAYYGTLEITDDNHIMQMMVLKDKISPSGLKIEGGDGDPAQIELKASNTVTGEWELLTFDFSDAIGVNYPRLVFFPDFPDDARTEGGTVYIDNIGWAGASPVGPDRKGLVAVYPNPATDLLTVQYPGIYRIAISNIVGQRVKTLEFQATGHKVFDVSDLKTGLYFMTLETADGSISTKFIRE